MLNWYKIIKSSPLPDISNEYPEKDDYFYPAITRLDRWITPETQEELEKEKRSYLGSGYYGVAYDMPDGLVEKVSSDLDDYETASKVIELQNKIGGSLPFCVHVYESSIIQDEDVEKDRTELYKIKVEKVNHLNNTQMEIFDRAASYFLTLLRYETENIMEILTGSDYSKKILEEYKNNKFLKNILMFIENMKSFESLYDIQISPHDIYGRNVGLRGNDLVILDIGCFTIHDN